MILHEEKRELLAIAREAIACALKEMVYEPPVPTTEGLAQPSGAFVTIKIDHELRGCIGYIESEKPLAEVVAEVAVKAALDDPRFAPMALVELEHANLEISILSPLRRIYSIEEIEIGVHGLVVALGVRRGLLLPQVATEHHLNREAFLEAVMRKAGLPPALWRVPETDPHLEMYVFEAEVIQEADVLQ
jgi:AmmeMemoRadiSam system protein A